MSKKERKYVDGQTVVVLKEKHGDRYYVVTTDEELFTLALNIVRGRHTSGYWYCEPEEPPTPPDYTEEDILKLPASLQKEARKTVNSYKSRLRDWQDTKDEWDAVQEVISTGNGRKAWEFLQSRFDHEYENIYLEPATGNEYRP